MQSNNNNLKPETKLTGGFGPNGAIIHYTTSKDTNVVIDTTSLLLVDSGGQYLGNYFASILIIIHVTAQISRTSLQCFTTNYFRIINISVL